MSDFHSYRSNLPSGVSRRDIEGPQYDPENVPCANDCGRVCHEDMLDDRGFCPKCSKERDENDQEFYDKQDGGSK